MNKQQQVNQMLHKVYDPELDQSLLELGFIEKTLINGNNVTVIFRLPTFWCSPNFAYIMAEDIHKYVSKLKWVNSVTVNLIDHCASEEINQGVTLGKRFSESFGKEAGGDLEEVRKTFQIKAFYARQEKIIKHLIKENFTQDEIRIMSLQQLKELVLCKQGQHLREKYLEKRIPLLRSTFAFPTPEGEILNLEEFKAYLLNLKRTRLSMEFNTHYCRGLLEARYNLTSNRNLLISNKK